MVTLRITAFLIITIFTFTGCAATGNLDLYPRRQIDRPYTLPKGLATWEPDWYSHSLKSSSGSTKATNFNALVWTQSLSDDLNIVWHPLPLILRYQIDRTDRNVYGVSLGVSKFGYSTDDKWTIGMVMSGGLRHNFNDWLALVTTLSLEHVIRTKGNSGDSWGAELSAGPFFQITDDIAILPKIYYALEHNYPSAIYKPETLESKTYSLVPLSILISWNLSRQWEFQINYQDKSIGYPTDIREESIAIRMINYW